MVIWLRVGTQPTNQFALVTAVTSEHVLAISAGLGKWLHVAAIITLHFLSVVPRKFVIFYIVVAQSAMVKLVALLTFDVASSDIMVAAN